MVLDFTRYRTCGGAENTPRRCDGACGASAQSDRVQHRRKAARRRIRPYDLREGIEIIISRPTDFSFPSGHASASFAAAAALFAYDKKWGAGALVLAALIAFSRLYLYVHYPSDVFAGTLLGILFGAMAYYIVKTVYGRIEKRRNPGNAQL